MAKKLPSFEKRHLLIFHRQDLITRRKNTLLLQTVFHILKAFLPLLLQQTSWHRERGQWYASVHFLKNVHFQAQDS